MVQNAGTAAQYITNAGDNAAQNIVLASADSATVSSSNMATIANSIYDVVRAAHNAANAVDGIAAGVIRGEANTITGRSGQTVIRTRNGLINTATGALQGSTTASSGRAAQTAIQAGIKSAIQSHTLTAGSFTPTGFDYAPKTVTFDKLISDLSDSVEIYNKSIETIDGEIALIKALQAANLENYKSDSKNSGGGGGGGGSGGSGSGTEDLEDALEAQKDLFKKYLSDIEHEIELRSHFDNESKNISELYKTLIKEVENELAVARALGLSETDEYIQELQKKWIEYSDALKELQDNVRDNAKDALDELVGIRVNMLKQEIQDRKEALDKQLDMLKKFYDKQKDLLQDQYDEEKYLEEQAEKRREVSNIQQEIAKLEYDTSAWAQKRKLELAQELADAQKDLDDFEKDHALETAQDELDRIYEMQEKELQDELDLLEEKENDSKALYNQALEDIKNGSVKLYEEMIDWNETYGDGIKDTITNAWEDAYKALNEYKTLYDEMYNGVNLKNVTGYKASSYEDSVIGSKATASKDTSTSTSTSTSSSSSRSTPAAPDLKVGESVTVKDGTKWYANSYGGGRSGVARSGKIKYINLNGTHPYNIEGLGWIKKTDIVGYASGTRNAIPGLHSIDEHGDEFVFQSTDGNRYRLFSGGEKVLSSKATNFLYDFANNGSQILQKLINSVSGGGLGTIRPVQNNVQLVTGDIIINGNADKATVSEIRRAQRESVELVLRQFNKLNK